MEKYLSYKRLGIGRDERAALIKTYNALGSRKIRHNPKPVFEVTTSKNLGKLVFNMSAIYGEARCGTVVCIGGYMAHFLKSPNPISYVCSGSSSTLYPLFYPSRHQYCGLYDNITKAQARTAIRQFLRTGTVDWSFANPQ